MKRIMILVTTTLLVFGSFIIAQPRNGSGAGLNNRQKPCINNMQNATGFARIQGILNLTDEQISKISDMRFEQEKLELDVKNKIDQNRLEVRKMMLHNKINENLLLKLTQENSEYRAKIKLSDIKLWLEIYNILDDVQKEKWTSTFGQRFGRDMLPDNIRKNRFDNDRFNFKRMR